MYYNITSGSTVATLPQAYTFSDGRTTGDFRELESAVHKAEGYLPLTVVKPQYDSRYQTLTEGAPVITANDVTITWTAEYLPLATVKAVRQAEVNTLRDLKFTSGFTFEGATYDSTDAAVTDVQGVVLSVVMTNSLPEDFVWKTAANTYVPMGVDDVKGLGITLMVFRKAIYAASWYHKEAIESLDTAEEVVAYDITNGW